MGLEFGKGHLDGVEIGAIGRQEEEPRAPFLENGLGLLALVAGEVVEDDDITGLERWRQLGLHIGLEGLPVHRPVDDPWRRQSIAP